MKTEKILQPPEATGERDLSVEHHVDDELARIQQDIVTDMVQLSESVYCSLDMEVITSEEMGLALHEAMRCRPEALITLVGRATKDRAKTDFIILHGYDPETKEFDRETMEEPPGGRLES